MCKSRADSRGNFVNFIVLQNVGLILKIIFGIFCILGAKLNYTDMVGVLVGSQEGFCSRAGVACSGLTELLVRVMRHSCPKRKMQLPELIAVDKIQVPTKE